jgi:hypothetical protein
MHRIALSLALLCLTFTPACERGIEIGHEDGCRELAETAGTYGTVRFHGETGGTIGFSNTIVGDLDGDGYDDIVMLDYGGSGSTSELYPDVRGSAYVFYGRECYNQDYSAAHADAIFRGAREFVSGLGDVDGDGLSDFAFTSHSGVHLVYGSSTRLSGEHLSSDVGVFITASYLGAPDIDYMKVTGSADFNGDGLDDLLIDVRHGASYPPEPAYTYVILGRPTPLPSPFSLRESDAVLTGSGTTIESYAVYIGPAPAGDLDNDGYTEMLIAINDLESPANADLVALFYGGPGAFSGELLVDEADAYFDLPTLWVTLGGLGDLDGDGYDDVALADNEVIHVLYGQQERFHGLYDPSVCDLVINAEGGSGYLAGLASSDINGDGFVDLLLGDPHDETYGMQTGGLFGLYGSGGRLSGSRELGSSDAILYGSNLSEGHGLRDDLGYGVGAGGDVNADGYNDFLVGAPGDVIGDDNGGLVYLLLGGPFD